MLVSFMNTAGVTVVVTVLANFQIKIVLDLQGYMEYGKQIKVLYKPEYKVIFFTGVCPQKRGGSSIKEALTNLPETHQKQVTFQ